MMASHAVGIAARELLHADRVVCLWLVPSNIIREQTLAALKDRQHPYRQALDTAFGGKVVVMDLADALYVSHGTLNGATAILVSTLAALRVEETDGRKVYESNGNLQPHFVGLDDALKSQTGKGRRRPRDLFPGQRAATAPARGHHGRSPQRADAAVVRHA